jgi:hypothetical protein
MATEITEKQKDILGLLTKMSNIVSNSVWMAENVEGSNVKDKIETAIWAAKHFIEEIESIK